MNNWPIKKLSDLINFLPKSKRKAGDGLEKGKYPFFTSSQIQNKFIDDADYKGEAIILGTGGSASLHISNNFSTSTDVFIIETKDNNLSNQFLYNYLQLRKDILEAGFHGQGLRHLSKDYLLQIEVPIPPLPIQQKIVSRLEAIKKAQELNAQQIELAEELFQSLLHRELDPKEKNWELKKLGEVTKFQYGYTASAKKEGNFRFIRITDIDDNGELRDLDRKYIQTEEKDTATYILEKSDLLVARTGATFGKILYFDSIEPSIFASYLIRVKSERNIIIPKFIWLFSRTPDYWRQARNLMTGSGQQQFNANKIKQIKIPLPPLETQKQIVEKLSAAQNYKKKLLEQKQKLQELFESVLDKAFKGELVK